MAGKSRSTRRELLAAFGAASAAATAGCGLLNDDGNGDDGGNGADDGETTDGNGDADTQLVVETRQATTVGSQSGILHGRLGEMDGYSTVDSYFEYRETGAEWTDTAQQSLSSPGEFSQELSDLSPDTEYVFRAVGEAGDGAVTGDARTFTTRPDPATAQITTDNLTLFVEEDGTDRVTVAQAAVENVGGGDSAPVTLGITWYDEEQTELGTDTTTLETLRPDETWLAQVTPGDVDGEAVASVTSETTVEGEPPTPVAGLGVAESALQTGEYPTEVTGAVENTGEEAVSPEPIARVFDEDGRVVADSRASMPTVPAGGTQRFAVGFFRRDAARIRAAFDHEVILDEPRE